MSISESLSDAAQRAYEQDRLQQESQRPSEQVLEQAHRLRDDSAIRALILTVRHSDVWDNVAPYVSRRSDFRVDYDTEGRVFTPLLAGIMREAPEMTDLALSQSAERSKQRITDELEFPTGETELPYVPTVVIGTGPMGQVFTAEMFNTVQKSPGDSTLSVDRHDELGGTFRVGAEGNFVLNSRTRKQTDERPKPGTPANINDLRPGVITPADTTNQAYISANELGRVVAMNQALTTNALTGTEVVKIVENPKVSPDYPGKLFVTLRQPDQDDEIEITTDSVVATTGLGEENPRFGTKGTQQLIEQERKKPLSERRIIGAEEFQKFLGDPNTKFPLEGIKRVAVIGGADSGAITVGSLLGYEPRRDNSVNQLDQLEQVVWFGQDRTGFRDFVESNRLRYAQLGLEFKRGGRFGRIDPISDKVSEILESENSGFVVEGDIERIDGIDLVVVATGYERDYVAELGKVYRQPIPVESLAKLESVISEEDQEEQAVIPGALREILQAGNVISYPSGPLQAVHVLEGADKDTRFGDSIDVRFIGRDGEEEYGFIDIDSGSSVLFPKAYRQGSADQLTLFESDEKTEAEPEQLPKSELVSSVRLASSLELGVTEPLGIKPFLLIDPDVRTISFAPALGEESVSVQSDEKSVTKTTNIFPNTIFSLASSYDAYVLTGDFGFDAYVQEGEDITRVGARVSPDKMATSLKYEDLKPGQIFGVNDFEGDYQLFVVVSLEGSGVTSQLIASEDSNRNEFVKGERFEDFLNRISLGKRVVQPIGPYSEELFLEKGLIDPDQAYALKKVLERLGAREQQEQDSSLEPEVNLLRYGDIEDLSDSDFLRRLKPGMTLYNGLLANSLDGTQGVIRSIDVVTGVVELQPYRIGAREDVLSTGKLFITGPREEILADQLRRVLRVGGSQSAFIVAEEQSFVEREYTPESADEDYGIDEPETATKLRDLPVGVTVVSYSEGRIGSLFKKLNDKEGIFFGQDGFLRGFNIDLRINEDRLNTLGRFGSSGRILVFKPKTKEESTSGNLLQPLKSADFDEVVDTNNGSGQPIARQVKGAPVYLAGAAAGLGVDRELVDKIPDIPENTVGIFANAERVRALARQIGRTVNERDEVAAVYGNGVARVSLGERDARNKRQQSAFTVYGSPSRFKRVMDEDQYYEGKNQQVVIRPKSENPKPMRVANSVRPEDLIRFGLTESVLFNGLSLSDSSSAAQIKVTLTQDQESGEITATMKSTIDFDLYENDSNRFSRQIEAVFGQPHLFEGVKQVLATSAKNVTVSFSIDARGVDPRTIEVRKKFKKRSQLPKKPTS